MEFVGIDLLINPILIRNNMYYYLFYPKTLKECTSDSVGTLRFRHSEGTCALTQYLYLCCGKHARILSNFGLEGHDDLNPNIVKKYTIIIFTTVCAR